MRMRATIPTMVILAASTGTVLTHTSIAAAIDNDARDEDSPYRNASVKVGNSGSSTIVGPLHEEVAAWSGLTRHDRAGAAA
jgi:hypothetical protein